MNNLERVRKKRHNSVHNKWASVDHLLWPVSSAEQKEKNEMVQVNFSLDKCPLSTTVHCPTKSILHTFYLKILVSVLHVSVYHKKYIFA